MPYSRNILTFTEINHHIGTTRVQVTWLVTHNTTSGKNNNESGLLCCGSLRVTVYSALVYAAARQMGHYRGNDLKWSASRRCPCTRLWSFCAAARPMGHAARGFGFLLRECQRTKQETPMVTDKATES
eukprot:231494-Prorocentrum_minimum.AAC.5